MIPDLLPVLRWGPKKALRAWAGQLVDDLNAWQVVPDDGSIIFTERLDGRGLSVAPWVYASSGAAGLPGGFKCAEDGALIRVFLGLINNFLPFGMAPGDAPPFTIAKTGGSGFVLLKVRVDSDGMAESAEIETHTTVPADSDPYFFDDRS